MNAAVIAAIIGLLTEVFKNWMSARSQAKKETEEKRAGWQETLKSRNLSSINAHIDRMRS